VGQVVILFDGRGAYSEARIKAAQGRAIATGLAGPLLEQPSPCPRLTIATAVPKGERADWLVEQASQLDVSTLQWLTCDRSVVKPREGGQKIDKWQRLAIESAKQCGRAWLMDIRPPVSLTQLLAASWRQVLWLEPGADSSPIQGILAGAEIIGDWLALVSPEGGWSDAERTLLSQRVQNGKAQRVRLTRTILRVETACAALAAVVMSRHPTFI
jgi:16S rRNA (uracil1498-N3)-methyltransferase